MDRMEKSISSSRAEPLTSAVSPIAHPLDEFYAQMGKPLPEICRLEPESVPEPYKSLLVHTYDMTPTLEKYHGGQLALRVLQREQREQSYWRGVALSLEPVERIVEFGAIKINLSLFSAAARNEILAERFPLGHILEEQKIVHSCRPRAFFTIRADGYIRTALLQPRAKLLYGRRNSLLDADLRSLAEVVEILPALEPSSAGG